MTDVLKGNFKTKHDVKVEEGKGKTLEEQFEKEALKRLGGSIAFVSKKRVLWESDSDGQAGGEGEKK